MNEDAACCSQGIPYHSHRRCVACTRLMGCRGEAAPSVDSMLCRECFDEGARLKVYTVGDRETTADGQ